MKQQSGCMEPPEHAYKPANGAVCSIMSEQLLLQQLPESHFKGLCALPKKFAAIRGSKHEGKIRVNKEASSCWLGLPSSQGVPGQNCLCSSVGQLTQLSTNEAACCCC